MATIRPRRGTTAPGTGTILQNELAVDTTNRRIYIGAADGSGVLVGSANKLSDFSATTSAELAGVISDETGFTSGALLVFNTSPNFITSLTTSSASFDLLNATATTINAFGAAANITMGASGTATTTIRGGTLVGNASTQNVFNTTATAVNAFGAATSLIIGASNGTSCRIRSGTTYFGPNSGTATFGSYGGVLNVGSGSGGVIGNDRPYFSFSSTAYDKITVANADLYLGWKNVSSLTNSSLIIEDYSGGTGFTAKIALPNSSLTASRTLNIPNLSGTIALVAGSDTQVMFNDGGSMGGDSGLTYNKTTDDLTIGGDLNVNGGDLFTTQTTATIFNTTATTVNIGGAATTMAIGNTATAAQTVNMFTGSTGASTYNFATGATANATTKTLNIGTGGAASSTTNINIGSSNGGTLTSNCPMVSPRLARVSSSAFDTRTGSFSPADTDNGKVFVINISGKTTATVTLDSLSVGWRARFLILGGSGVTFTSTGGTVFGTFGTGGGGNSALTEVVEVYCYATNAYIAS